MYNYSSYLPVRHISVTPTRNVPYTERAKKLRVAWFALGIICGSALTTGVFFTAQKLNASNDAQTAATQPVNSAPQSSLPIAKPVHVAKKAAPSLQWPRSVNVTVPSGHALLDILMDNGVANADAFQIVDSLNKKFDPKDLRAGDKLLMELEKDKTRNQYTAATLKNLEIKVSPTELVRVERNDAGDYASRTVEKEVHTELARTAGTINKQFDGLYKVAKKDKTPDEVISALMKAYSYDVDFQRDIHPGDKIEILYEKKVTEDNQTVGAGKILYATLSTKGTEMPIYYFNDGNSDGFFKENGESIVKKLLRTPVDGARVSSGFGMRQHPILGYTKMHKGIDFAAPIGTPIYAAGDGTVTFAGNKGGYGNFVMIEHNDTYATGYGHCSRIASGITPGRKIKQGDVIAYVGNTGRSTGPHLHYEIVQSGVQVNPTNIKFAGLDKLSGKRLASFNAFKQDVASKLAELAKPQETKVASR